MFNAMISAVENPQLGLLHCDFWWFMPSVYLVTNIQAKWAEIKESTTDSVWRKIWPEGSHQL